MSLRSQFPDVLLADALPVLEAVILDEFEKQPDKLPMIFNMLSSSQWGEQSLTMAGSGAVPEKSEGEGTADDAPIDGYDKTYLHVTYALKMGFSEETIEDNRLDMVGKSYRSLGMGAYQTRQIVGWTILNNAFTDTGPDGATLCSTSHTMINGQTYANRPSSDIALSVAGLREMDISMMRQVNHRGLNISIMTQTIVAPPELRQTLDELIKSPDKPDTDNRSINAYYSDGYQKCISPFLTSTTAWFGIAAPSQNELRYYDRKLPQTRSWIDDDTGDARTRIRFRLVAGYSDFVGTWGTTG